MAKGPTVHRQINLTDNMADFIYTRQATAVGEEVKSPSLHEMASTQGFQFTEESWSSIAFLLAFPPFTPLVKELTEANSPHV